MWIMFYATTCKSFEWFTVATLDGHRPFTHRLIEYMFHQRSHLPFLLTLSASHNEQAHLPPLVPVNLVADRVCSFQMDRNGPMRDHKHPFLICNDGRNIFIFCSFPNPHNTIERMSTD